MYKILLISITLYIFFELLCHGFALFMRKSLNKVVLQNARKTLYLQFIQHTFYRTLLLISIILMNHIYTEVALFEQNQWVRFTWSMLVTLLILGLLYCLNAWIIHQVLIKQMTQQSVSAVFKQKISYILLHPLEFKHLSSHQDYLTKSVWINRLLSLIAFILLFLDVQLLYNVAHS